jgi:hypothetical protein
MHTGLEPLLEKVAIAMAGRGTSPLGGGPYRKAMLPGAARDPTPPGRLWRGIRNTGLAVGAGALTAGALGLGHQHDEDQKRYPLVYQPMNSDFGM